MKQGMIFTSLALTMASANAKTCDRVNNMNAVYSKAGDPAGWPRTETTEECEALCMDDPECHVYVHHTKRFRESDWNKRCVTFSTPEALDHGEWVPELNVISGFCYDSDWGHSPEWKKKKGQAQFSGSGTIYIKGGNHYVETKESYQRPFKVSVEMKQTDEKSAGCGMVAVFPNSHRRHSGYNAGVGFGGSQRDTFGVGAPKLQERGKHGSTGTWHTVMIQVNEDNVEFYLDGELRDTVNDSKLQSGRVRLGNSCVGYTYRNVMVAELPSISSDTIMINFQPANMAVPAGYLRDSGELFHKRGSGLAYGWSCDFTGDVRDRFNRGTRDSSLVIPDRRQACDKPVGWKLALPNAIYTVKIGYSDPEYGVNTGGCKIQGRSASVGTVSKDSVGGSAQSTVTVTNQELEFSGEWNWCSSISYITIKQRRPEITMDQIKINFQPSGMSVPSGYMRDSGEVFQARESGLAYGWSCDFTGGTRDRFNRGTRDSSLVIPDRLRECDKPVGWKIALPNGSYAVKIGYSDPQYGANTGGCKLQGRYVGVGFVSKGGSGGSYASTFTVKNQELEFSGRWDGVESDSCSAISYIHIKRREGRRRAESEAPVRGIQERLNFAQA